MLIVYFLGLGLIVSLEREKIWVSAVANKDSQMENYRSEISALEQENDHVKFLSFSVSL